MGINMENFYKRIELVGEKIPYGTVATYGQIALLCGKPQNSRQVGYALRKEKVGDSFPAHRIVNSNGFLSGAAAFCAPDMQKNLLLDEGVPVNEDNKVNLKKYGWKHSLSDAEALYELYTALCI